MPRRNEEKLEGYNYADYTQSTGGRQKAWHF